MPNVDVPILGVDSKDFPLEYGVVVEVAGGLLIPSEEVIYALAVFWLAHQPDQNSK